MTRILVVDHDTSPICGVRDLGDRIAYRLAESPNLEVHHAFCGSIEAYHKALWACDLPDVVVVNWRPDLMPWWQPPPPGERPVLLGVAHNYDADTAERCALAIYSAGFSHALFLDPSEVGTAHPFAVAVDRPLPPGPPPRARIQGIRPRIGSFGFAFPHKGFVDVAREIADQIDGPAIYRLHMPEAWFNGAQGQPLYGPSIRTAIMHEFDGTDLVLAHSEERMTPEDSVAWLQANDVNCLFYAPGQPDAGLSSALDYLIAARRPIMVSAAAMFRHGHPETAVWPRRRLGEVLDAWDDWQARAEELYARRAGRFLADFERLLGRIL